MVIQEIYRPSYSKIVVTGVQMWPFCPVDVTWSSIFRSSGIMTIG